MWSGMQALRLGFPFGLLCLETGTAVHGEKQAQTEQSRLCQQIQSSEWQMCRECGFGRSSPPLQRFDLAAFPWQNRQPTWILGILVRVLIDNHH